jgi:hypothetical protein
LIVGGLAVVALGAFLFLLNLALGTGPFVLLLLVCPLMMFFMMGGMGMQHGGGQGNQQHTDHLSQPTPPPLSGLTREEQIAGLKARLAYLEAQPAALSDTAREKKESPVVREAEAIARAADYQGHRHV